MTKESLHIPDRGPTSLFPRSAIASDHPREMMNASPPPDYSLVRLLSNRRTTKRSQLLNLANLPTSLDPLPNVRPRTLADILDEAIRLANETFDSDIELEGSTQEIKTDDDAFLTDPNGEGVDSRGGRLPQ
jgi:hypothetical protein